MQTFTFTGKLKYKGCFCFSRMYEASRKKRENGKSIIENIGKISGNRKRVMVYSIRIIQPSAKKNITLIGEIFARETFANFAKFGLFPEILSSEIFLRHQFAKVYPVKF